MLSNLSKERIEEETFEAEQLRKLICIKLFKKSSYIEHLIFSKL